MEDDNLINNPNLYGAGCLLSAHGRGFEPALFLQDAALPSESVIAYGKLGFPEEFRNQAAAKGGEDSAAFFDAKILALKLSASGVHLEQQRAAIDFLRRYGDEISRLSQFPGVEQVNLRFVAEGEDFSESYPDELFILAGECGLTSIM
jgi:hypothetical protein